LRFTWDEARNRSKRQKHRVSFETAALVFDDPNHLSRFDREVGGEWRWHTIGMAKGLQLLLVVHTILESDHEEEIVRIISARKATPQERRIYAHGE
jgi:uncharacterized DUF497 family protein